MLMPSAEAAQPDQAQPGAQLGQAQHIGGQPFQSQPGAQLGQAQHIGAQPFQPHPGPAQPGHALPFGAAQPFGVSLPFGAQPVQDQPS